MIKKIICIIIFSVLFILPISAEESDFYKQQTELIDTEKLESTLPDNTKGYLEDFSIDLNDSNWVNNLNPENIFSHIWSFVKNGAKTPIKTFGIILALIVLSTVISSASQTDMNETVIYITVLAVSTALISPIYSLITATVDGLKASAYFMSAFIPVFAAIVAASGKALTSVTTSSVLLLAANFVNYISNFAVIPLMCGHLSISISASVSPLLNDNNIAETIKKISLWIMGFVSTVFLGILSIQTTVNASADSLTMRTAKFIVGSSVPVAGNLLSEALSTVTGSMTLLKSSVGIWGVVVLLLIFLPIIVELILWRLSLWGLSFFSNAFSLAKVSGILKSIDSVLAMLVGIVLLSSALFIISLTVVILGGKT